MKGFKKYQMLNMFFAYNEKTNNYFLVRHYSYGDDYSKKYYEIYSEYKELSHLINDFNKYMKLEFIDNVEYVNDSLSYSKVIESNSSLKKYSEIDIMKANFEVLKDIGLDNIIINLELVKTSLMSSKLKELIKLYLVNKKEEINDVIDFKTNIWHKESLDKLGNFLKENINDLQKLKNSYVTI